ncbi:MAG: hypothetical protein OEV68_13080, partial [candidate division Zixibacteria bacterium]|nr:hypothetical protein [candidate division Zixibacteria bacterium]
EGGGSWSQTWFAPDVGAVRRYLFSAWSDGSSIRISVNQTWELLRYDLSTFYLSRFPNSVGTQWVYQVIDTSLDLVDTVTVTIKSEVPVSWADSGWLWQRRGRLATDTVYMGVSDDILFVSHSDDILYFDSWYYEFPLTVGRHWGMEYFGAIPVIVDKGAVTSLAGEFPSAFHYRMSGGAFNDYWTVDDWLVPGVGMVRREYTTFGLGPAFEQQWNLISYRVQ